MIKYFNIQNQLMNLNGSEYKKFSSYVFDKENEYYKVVSDESIIYKSENESTVSKKTGFNLEEYSETLEDYINMIRDGGYSLNIAGLSISMDECAWKLMKVINQYEERIYEAHNIQDEIYAILTEIALKVLNEKVRDFKRDVKNGVFVWS